MVRRVATLFMLVALIGVGAGCAETEDLEQAQEDLEVLDEQPGIVRVKAPAGKCWSGAIGDSTKDGCGSKNFNISGENIIVANAQKQDPGKWRLQLILEVEGQVVDRASTSAEFGIAQVGE